MDEKYRILIHLCFYEGYAIKEISRILSLLAGTIGTRLARGKEQLKNSWEECMMEPNKINKRYKKAVDQLPFSDILEEETLKVLRETQQKQKNNKEEKEKKKSKGSIFNQPKAFVITA